MNPLAAYLIPWRRFSSRACSRRGGQNSIVGGFLLGSRYVILDPDHGDGATGLELVGTGRGG